MNNIDRINSLPCHNDRTDNHDRSGVISPYHQRPWSISLLSFFREASRSSILFASAKFGIWERCHGNTLLRWSEMTSSQWSNWPVVCSEELLISTKDYQGPKKYYLYGILFTPQFTHLVSECLRHQSNYLRLYFALNICLTEEKLDKNANALGFRIWTT